MDTMLLFSTFLGLFFIILGFAFKKKHKLSYLGIKRTKVKKDMLNTAEYHKYANQVKNGVVILGILILLSGLISYLLKWTYGYISSILVFSFAFSLYVIYKGRNITLKSIRSSFIQLGSIFLLIILFLWFFSQNADVQIVNDGFEISGIYGEEIPLRTIEKIELIDSIPHIGLRTNGFAFGEIKKGYFLLGNNIGKSKLIIQSSDGPYIYIRTDQGEKYFFNTKNKKSTIAIYYSIQDKLLTQNNR